ncbi:hypothetical protein [Pseudomonas citronellolis]|uniref:hypothetical protein n=1 Tax=Pseudomonas citronellolis TaxID=53408 RepID=UPI000A754CB8|nr:hypothetical protein [Pseudomonas citronellolis]
MMKKALRNGLILAIVAMLLFFKAKSSPMRSLGGTPSNSPLPTRPQRAAERISAGGISRIVLGVKNPGSQGSERPAIRPSDLAEWRRKRLSLPSTSCAPRRKDNHA